MNPEKKDDFELPERFWKEEPQHFYAAYRLSLNPLRLAVKLFLDRRTREAMNALDLHSSHIVADIGCGSGEQLNFLGRIAQKVYAIDISEAMLAEARRKTQLKNIEFIHSSCQPCPLEDVVLDRVLSLGVLDYVFDIDKFVSEFTRIIRPGGRLVFTVPKKPSLFAPLRWSNRMRRRIMDMPRLVNVLNQNQVRQLVENAGLEIINLDSLWTTMWLITARRP